jgi:hypothetical protein
MANHRPPSSRIVPRVNPQVETRRVELKMPDLPLPPAPPPPPEEESLAELARHLEDEFFAERDVELVDALHHSYPASETEHKLAELLGISDPAALHGLAHLEVGLEVMAAAVLLPLIEVAWCDGEASPPEKAAILHAADEMHILRDSPLHLLMKNWLDHRPSRAAVDAWSKYVVALCATLSPVVVFNLRRAIIGRAEKVASAAGGILGFGNKISTAERSCLDTLSKAFRQGATVHGEGAAEGPGAGDENSATNGAEAKGAESNRAAGESTASTAAAEQAVTARYIAALRTAKPSSGTSRD